MFEFFLNILGNTLFSETPGMWITQQTFSLDPAMAYIQI